MGHFSLSHTSKSYPKLPYERIKDAILGKRYILSLVFVGERRAQEINQKNRDKDYIPNVLSFPLDTKTGEIFITPQVAKRQAQARNLTYTQYVGFLYIHGLLHLKGLKHGTKMEREEQRLLKQFILNKQ